jgi:hypothetical protein
VLNWGMTFSTKNSARQDFDEPRIILTIGIPHFEQVEQLRRTLSSVSKLRRLDEVKVFVSDNHSNDLTVSDIVEAAKGVRHIEVERHSTNIGAPGNIRFIVERSTTKYVWLLGAGELLEEDSLEKLLPILSEKTWLGGTLYPVQTNQRAFGFSFRQAIHRSERLCCLSYRESISLNIFNRIAYLDFLTGETLTPDWWPHIRWTLAVNSAYPDWRSKRFHLRSPLVKIDRTGEVWWEKVGAHKALLSHISLLQSASSKSKSLTVQYLFLVLVGLPKQVLHKYADVGAMDRMLKDAFQTIDSEPIARITLRFLSLMLRLRGVIKRRVGEFPDS